MCGQEQGIGAVRVAGGMNAIGTEWFDANPDEVLALAVDTIWVSAPM
ncbi:hypothetical protein GCM10010503_37610 [Streptomyces lucensis JCM 4490]|uniref:Uncharacterized protein n=1 Tax=Streptomyces lucensis JCM 4490 TaxID=1306176 RepID=A0A918JB99_9ACTN|nr:hypothetical protein GCM10010503_37610 [Streptomyces lucensis JCM 4490]